MSFFSRPWVRAAIEPLLVLGYMAVMLFALARMATVRLYWFDELFTLHLARSPETLWANLARGVDNNPPLGYWLTHLCVWIFGEVEWAVRLPAMLGAMLGCFSLYLFVRHRRGPFEAFLAMAIVPMSASVWVYFLEARPYGLMLGFTGLSLLCYQRRWPIGFAFSLILGMTSHYYFVVPLVAFGLAELVWIIQHRRVDIGIVCGFVVVTLTLAALYPLWGYGPKQYVDGFWAKVKFNRPAVEDAFHELYRKETMLPMALALIAVGLSRKRTDEREPYPMAEAAAMAALAAGPLIGVAVGAKLTGAFYYRYIIPSMLGIAGLMAYALGRACGGQRWVLLFAGGSFVLFGLVGTSKIASRHYRAEANELHATAQFLHDHATGTVLVESPFEFGRLIHYHPELSTAFVADVELAMKHTKSDTLDRGLYSLATIEPIRLMTPDQIVAKLAAGESIDYFGPRYAWHTRELTERGVTFTALAARSNGTLYRLDLKT